MKNIHVLPTDKPSRLYFYKGDDAYPPQYGLRSLKSLPFNDSFTNQNIYITNDEEIKEGNWYLTNKNTLCKCIKTDSKYVYSLESGSNTNCKKIILTTDQYLIKDGVQAIDKDGVQAIHNDFLEWFVKNPSCEEIEFTSERRNWKEINWITIYKIIIPKYEPKQERSYSEEEVLEFTQTMIMQYKFGNNNIEQMDLLKKTLQLFKKK